MLRRPLRKVNKSPDIGNFEFLRTNCERWRPGRRRIWFQADSRMAALECQISPSRRFASWQLAS